MLVSLHQGKFQAGKHFLKISPTNISQTGKPTR